jgi:hypothetical protein
MARKNCRTGRTTVLERACTTVESSRGARRQADELKPAGSSSPRGPPAPGARFLVLGPLSKVMRWCARARGDQWTTPGRRKVRNRQKTGRACNLTGCGLPRCPRGRFRQHQPPEEGRASLCWKRVHPLDLCKQKQAKRKRITPIKTSADRFYKCMETCPRGATARW